MILGLGLPLQLQADDSETALITAFLYNFLKYIHWPSALDKPEAYQLCTVNDDHLGDSPRVLVGKTVNGIPVTVRRSVSQKELKNCHLVYIDSAENVQAIVDNLKSLPVVSVSNSPDFIDKGGTIGLLNDGSRLGFEINLDAANSSDLHISAQLLRVAKDIKQGQ